jgi:hypothetical protein
MGLLDYIVGRIGSIDPKTGQRVRLRSHATDDWGNTADHIEIYNPHSGKWEHGPTVEGSGTGGHYS